MMQELNLENSAVVHGLALDAAKLISAGGRTTRWRLRGRKVSNGCHRVHCSSSDALPLETDLGNHFVQRISAVTTKDTDCALRRQQSQTQTTCHYDLKDHPDAESNSQHLC